MGNKMGSAPVYFTIGQVQFNTITDLDTYVPRLQEKLRKLGYPDFKAEKSMTLNLAAAVENEGEPPSIQRSQRYLFFNRDRTCGFILEQNALSFQTTDYDTFQIFSDHLFQGLEMLHHAIVLDYTERVGIRYLDAVVPRDNESLDQYLIPEVLGLYRKMDEFNYTFSESMIQTKSGSLISRATLQKGLLGFPPDLHPVRINIMPRFSQINGIHAILDIDSSYMVRESFELKELKDRLSLLHKEVIKAFQIVITDHARTVWA